MAIHRAIVPTALQRIALGTRNWVILYVERTDQPEGHITVVTEHVAPFDGKYILRGREQACGAYFKALAHRRLRS